MKIVGLFGLLLIGTTTPGWSQSRAQVGTEAPNTAGLQVFFSAPSIILPRLYAAAIAHSSEIKRLDVGYDIAQTDVKLARKRVLNSFGFNSSYNYGTLPYFANSDPNNPVTPIYQINPFSLGARAQYSAGVNMAIPIDVLASRRTAIHRQELLVDQTVAQRHTFEDALRQQVITQYQALALARTLMMHYQEALQSASISRQIADKRFQQGELQIDEQMMASDFYGKALLAYEEARNRYQTAELLLENLIGVPITSISLAK
ncbi:MAG: hypothetical protein EOO63_13700 [Hymenobacter sp.]|nr:MAG: hypothetical protein EOO63_13700 [Hymenobacter sp.]